jgi:hypothetical protein
MAAFLMPCARLAPALVARLGARTVCTAGLVLIAGALVVLAQLTAASGYWLLVVGLIPLGAGMGHSGYASTVLGPLLVSGAGIGLSLPPSMNTGTFGVAPDDAGVASATLNVGQQIGGSIGTSLLNSIATTAAASYLTSHLTPVIAASPQARGALQATAAVHGYTTAFWWTAGLFAAGAVIGGSLLRRGPLVGQAKAAPAHVKAPQHQPALSART